MDSITVKRGQVTKKGLHAKAGATPNITYCNLLTLLSDNGEFAQFQALASGCITINLFDPDGTYSGSLQQNVVKGQTVNVEDPYTFTCGCD